MTPTVETAAVLRLIKEIVSDQQGLNAFFSCPKQEIRRLLTTEEQEIWSMVVQHSMDLSAIWTCGGEQNEDSNNDDDDTDEDGDADSSTDSKPQTGSKRKRSKTSPGDPWGRFGSIQQHQLPDLDSSYISQYRGDPSLFLNDQVALVHPLGEPGMDEGDLNLAHIQYTLHLDARRPCDLIRSYFAWLLYFDLAKLKNPGGSGLVGKNMQEEILALVKGKVPDGPDPSVKKIREWSKQGRKVEFFCQRLGVGSLFFLHKWLSESFLRRRFTHSGKYLDPAFEHLQSLGIKEMAESSGANQFGQQVREHLISPFRKHHMDTLVKKTDRSRRHGGKAGAA